jgi:hypothetical protein
LSAISSGRWTRVRRREDSQQAKIISVACSAFEAERPDSLSASTASTTSAMARSMSVGVRAR